MAFESAPPSESVTSERTLVLETPNPLDLSIAELQELAANLEHAIAANGQSGVSVRARGNEPLGAGNQLVDYLFIFLPDPEFLKEAAFNAVMASVIYFMRKRFKKKHESRRPREVQVYGPDGKLLKTFKLISEDAEPEESGPGED